MEAKLEEYRKRHPRKPSEEKDRKAKEATNEKIKTMRENAARRTQAMNCKELGDELDNIICDEKGYIYGCKKIKELTNTQLDKLEKYVKSAYISDRCRKKRLNALKKIRKKLTGSSEKTYDKNDEQMITQRRIRRLQEEEQGLKF